MIRTFFLILVLISPVAHANLYDGNPIQYLDPFEMSTMDRVENALNNNIDLFLYVERLSPGQYVAVFRSFAPFFIYEDTTSRPVVRKKYRMNLENIMSRIENRKKRYADNPGKLIEDKLAISELIHAIYDDPGRK